MADSPDRFVITPRGIWEIESHLGKITIPILLASIDVKYFDLFGITAPLTEKEKTIVFSMIAVRSFSRDSALDLKRGEPTLKTLMEVLTRSYELLCEVGLIKELKKEDLFGGRGNEHPVSQLIRHTDSLVKKTKGVFATLGGQRYFLEIYSEDAEVKSRQRLELLVKMIFDKPVPATTKNSINEYLNEIAYKKCAYLFDADTHKYAHPEYDDEIANVIDDQYREWQNPKI
jgi:hypothetical protein